MKKKKKISFWRKTPKEELCQRNRFRFLSKLGILEIPFEVDGGIKYIVMTKRKEKKLRIKLLKGIKIIGKNKIENLDFVDDENYIQEKERIVNWFLRTIPYDAHYLDNYRKRVNDFIGDVIYFATPLEYGLSEYGRTPDEATEQIMKEMYWIFNEENWCPSCGMATPNLTKVGFCLHCGEKVKRFLLKDFFI